MPSDQPAPTLGAAEIAAAQEGTYAPDRYARMVYRRSGRSGLQLPAISLGGWHTFGG